MVKLSRIYGTPLQIVRSPVLMPFIQSSTYHYRLGYFLFVCGFALLIVLANGCSPKSRIKNTDSTVVQTATVGESAERVRREAASQTDTVAADSTSAHAPSASSESLELLSLLAKQVETSGSVSKESDLQNMYIRYLTDEGYKPKVDKDGDVQFKHESKVYFISVDERDPEFFRIVLAGIWSIESELERQKVLVAADHSNATSKVAKVFTLRDRVWVSIEVFLSKPEQFRQIFKRSMSALQNGVIEFVKKMKE